MVFSSIVFVCLFLPAVYIVNLALPARVSNGFLLAASLFLYAWGEPAYTLLLLGCIAVNYALGRLMARKRFKRLLLTLGVAFNVAVLALFKYSDYAVSTLNALLGTSLPLPGIAMPIGISFFTFQSMSYVVDVYRGACEAQNSLTGFALYVAFFPQLIAGPIVKYHDIEPYLSKRRVTLEDSALGLCRFAAGLGKKVLIANILSDAVDRLYTLGGGALNAPLAWLAACGYALQIYFDFSGYSDMAIGMSRMFGFVIPENFSHPFTATSLRQFWRRWHMSLSNWFREYLYIPLGGNRRGAFRTHLNRLAVFLLTGLWHGASWNFVLWGLGHGVLLTLESCNVIPASRLKGHARLIGVFYTMISAVLLFVLFRADTLRDALAMFRAMFSGFSFTAAQRVYLADILTNQLLLTLPAAMFGATPAPAALMKRFLALGRGAEAVRFVLTALLLAACVAALIARTNNPFIYFRF